MPFVNPRKSGRIFAFQLSAAARCEVQLRVRGALDQSELERRALAGRFEQFTADAMREQATEQDVLKRLLGKRYESLRAKIAGETSAANLANPAPKP